MLLVDLVSGWFRGMWFMLRVACVLAMRALTVQRFNSGQQRVPPKYSHSTQRIGLKTCLKATRLEQSLHG